VSTKSKRIRNSCRQTWLKWAVSDSGLQQLKIKIHIESFRHLTHIHFMLLLFVGNSIKLNWGLWILQSEKNALSTV
jgi:hypothetical protein